MAKWLWFMKMLWISKALKVTSCITNAQWNCKMCFCCHQLSGEVLWKFLWMKTVSGDWCIWDIWCSKMVRMLRIVKKDNFNKMNKKLVNKMLMVTWIPSSPLREDFMIQPCQSAQVHGSDRSAMKQSSEPRIYLIMKVILINSFCFVTDQSLWSQTWMLWEVQRWLSVVAICPGCLSHSRPSYIA